MSEDLENIEDTEVDEEIEEIPEEDEPIPEIPEEKPITESILNSVKCLLGLTPENTEFDPNVIMGINSAMFVLSQHGVNSEKTFSIKGAEETYADYLGDREDLVHPIKMYLYARTRLGFDPPTNSAIIEVLKEMIRETEVRILYQIDIPSEECTCE